MYTNPSNLDSLAEDTLELYEEYYSHSRLLPKRAHDTGPVKRDYITDGKEHFLFKEENFALNFTLPLLIECGYKFEQITLENLVYNEERAQELHPAERDYLMNCLECPKSLQLACRDTLRGHFKGHQIHKYMSVSDIPKRVEDFILLKTLLPTLKCNEVHSLIPPNLVKSSSPCDVNLDNRANWRQSSCILL